MVESPLMFWGDFNVSRFCSERFGSDGFNNAMMELSEFIEENQLIDTPLLGGLFTWYNGRFAQSWSRIDHFLFSPSWESLFPDVSQKRLLRLYLNHFLIILESGYVGRGKKPFRLENIWLKAEGFVDKVGTWWRSYAFSGSPNFVLDSELKALKDIKKWNCEVFGDLAFRKSSLLRELSSLDALDEGGLIHEEGKVQKM